MSWIIVALIAGLCSNIYNIFSRTILRQEKDSTAYGWITDSSRLLLGTALLFFDSKMVSVKEGICHIILLGVIEMVVFLNERQDIGKKLLGTAITLAGVLILTLMN